MEEVIQELHKELGIPITALRAVCESPFRFLIESMRRRDLQSINIMHFGKFSMHPKKAEWIRINVLKPDGTAYTIAEHKERKRLKDEGRRATIQTGTPGMGESGDGSV